jgi:hypothetical protein
MIKKIDVKQLRKNMYICGTDRKWIDLPFFRQKFLITSSDQINTIKEYCKIVYIDTDKGVDVISSQEDQTIPEHEISVDADLSAQGIYSPGCVVELNTGEIGLITQENHQNRLRPKLSIMTNAQKQLLTQDYVIDLSSSKSQAYKITNELSMDDPIVELLITLHAQTQSEQARLKFLMDQADGVP